MNRKPLIAAGAFALAALIFLIWSNDVRSGAATKAADDKDAWARSVPAMEAFANVATRPELKAQAAGQDDDPDVVGAMGKIVPLAGLQTDQMKLERIGGASSSEGVTYRIQFEKASISAMGKLFETLRRTHSNIVSREIDMRLPSAKDAVPGIFAWKVFLGVPKAERRVSRR